jgi:CubicO group peptidase (beta-lactamase class C family)
VIKTSIENILLKSYDNERLNQIVEKTVNKKDIYGAVFCISSGDGSRTWCGASGNLNIDSKYYIASINKLFVSSLVLKLINEGRLTFDDNLSKFLPENLMKGLHILNGTDYSSEIRIKHLLSMTSGLSCYLDDKDENGRHIMHELETGVDSPWPTEQVKVRPSMVIRAIRF